MQVSLMLSLLVLPTLAQDQPDIVWLRSGQQGRVLSLAAKPDGTVIASAGTDQTIKLWQAADGTVLHSYAGMTPTACAPEGNLFASGGQDGTVVLARYPVALQNSQR
jgi:WD40 repeat protein